LDDKQVVAHFTRRAIRVEVETSLGRAPESRQTGPHKAAEAGKGQGQEESDLQLKILNLPLLPTVSIESDSKHPKCRDENAPILDTMRGPTERSNWIVPGKVLQGAYPTADEMIAIVEAGCTTLVNLSSKEVPMKKPQ